MRLLSLLLLSLGFRIQLGWRATDSSRLSVSPLPRIPLVQRQVDLAQEVVSKVGVLQRVLVRLERGGDLVLVSIPKRQLNRVRGEIVSACIARVKTVQAHSP